MLEGFEPLVIASGTPFMTVTKNGVSFNKSVIEKLEKSEYIQLFIDRNERRFAIAACTEDAKNAVKFYRGREISDGIRMNNSDLRATLLELAEKDSDDCFRARGFYQHSDHAIIFDLAATEPIRSTSR